jgi:CBS domain-containing protein
MSIAPFCNRDVVVVEQNCSVLEAARLMRAHHVGALVIVASGDGVNRPVAVVTDRDLVIEVMAVGLDPEAVLVAEVVTERLCSVPASEGVFETMRLMRDHGVRRLPVLDDGGGLLGIITIDDLIALLAEEMNELSRLITHQQAKEFRRRK